ncbi:MAG: hypothetical protein ACJASL_002975 [Paraglaciecola sp.]|jgi:hypothetical protein
MFKKLLGLTAIILTLVTPLAVAEVAKPDADGITRIHLDQYGGHFTADKTLAGLKAGKYEITVANKTKKMVGFQLQNFKTHEQMDMFPLEPGETRVTTVEFGEEGVRFRCPINPTPWYDLDNIKAAI